MTLQVVNTLYNGVGHYRQRTTLDGAKFNLIFDYNTRDLHWHLTINDIDDNPIKGCASLKLVQNWAPMRLARSLKAPKGQFVVASESSDEPGLTDLGKKSILYYIPEADLGSLVNA